MRLRIDPGTTRIVAAAGQPIGDISVRDEIQFPFDASLQSTEEYTGGGYERHDRLVRRAQNGIAVVPGRIRTKG